MARKDKAELVSICNTENGISIGVNIKKKNGKSVYLCPDEKCMELSLKKKRFSRLLNLELSNDFYDKLKDYFKTLTRE